MVGDYFSGIFVAGSGLIKSSTILALEGSPLYFIGGLIYS
jgi:hypothetical protein